MTTDFINILTTRNIRVARVKKSVLNFTTSNIRAVWSSNLMLMTAVTFNNNCFKYYCYQSPQLKFNDRGFFNIMLLMFSIWILMTRVAFNCVTSNIRAVWVSNINLMTETILNNNYSKYQSCSSNRLKFNDIRFSQYIY